MFELFTGRSPDKNWSSSFGVSSLNKDMERVRPDIPWRRKGFKLGRQKQNVFVIDFKGDKSANGVCGLAREVSLLTRFGNVGDEVVLRLESPGGMAHAYGQCAAELERLKDAGMTLTVCVDQVAASGGYMMAAVANKIVASPFAIIGSIGVIVQLPNFNGLLEQIGVHYLSKTAGKHKMPVSTFGKVDSEGLDYLQSELDATHQLFKEHIKRLRPQVDIDDVGDGRVFWGRIALEKKLVDELRTSEGYLAGRIENAAVWVMSRKERKSMVQRLGESLEMATMNILQRAGLSDMARSIEL
jgi:serine protease SohB